MNASPYGRLRIPLLAAAATFLFHVAANPHYGFFRDELYFIICGRHPQWGYVDQPPVIPLLAAGSQLFGHSLVALRAISALFAAGSVFVACRLVQEFDGGEFAQILAAVCVALSPILATFGVIVAPDSVGLWAWPLVVLYVVRLARGVDPRWWLAVGLVCGIALESKYSAAFFLVTAFAGIVLTRTRTALKTPWFAWSVSLGVAIALPNILWQAHHAFPMIELLQNGQLRKNIVLDPLSFALQQLEITNPVLALVWIAGLIWAFFTPPARWIGIGFFALLVLMTALHAKSYYMCDAYPALFALGAVWIERRTSRARFLRPAAVVLATLAGFVLIPLVLPVLPVTQFVEYQAALSKVLPLGSMTTEHHSQSVLPQTYADMHGWPQLAQVVAGVYDALPSAERSQAVIVVQNYGEAAAIQFFTEPELPVISGHNQYFLWGTHGYSGNVLIDVNGDCGRDQHLFRSAQKVATFTAPYVMPYEDDVPIMLCRGINRPLAQIWPGIKNYI